MVPATWPVGVSSIRQPAPAVSILPSVLGRLPTTTQPSLRTTIAVVNPTPPGQPVSVCGRAANTLTDLSG